MIRTRNEDSAQPRSVFRVPRSVFITRLWPEVGGNLMTLVFVVLVATFAALGYTTLRLHRIRLEKAQLESATRVTELIARSTSHYMLRNDREALKEIVGTIGQQRDVAGLRILAADSRIAFSSLGSEIGQPAEPIPARVVARTETFRGLHVIGVVTPIRNSPSCSSAECHAHPVSQTVLGALDVKLSLAGTDAGVRKTTRQFFVFSGVATVIGLIVTAFVVFRMSREITAANRTLEERVRLKTAELQRAHEQMIHAEKLSSLGKLAAVVAHEINNPLSGMLTSAKLLRKWLERGDAAAHAEDMRESALLIESESRRCGEIVRSLLSFARVEPMNVSDVDVNRLVHQCLKLIEHKLDLAEIALDLHLDPALPALRGDPGQVEQLLLALIMNSIEAMPHAGTLRLNTSTDPAREHIVIVVEDNGIGIPPHVLSQLFEPFVTTKEEKGVGLGLAISQRIVERHHGSIDVWSEVGHGTRFTISIPVTALAVLPSSEENHESANWTYSHR
jgi:two-component system, NtrC family, sensor kinase